MTYAKRVDGNHAEIKKLFRDMGAQVCDTSAFGDGFPDLIVGWRGVTHLVEIKDGSKPPSARKLTPDQTIWHAEWKRCGGPLHVVRNVTEALAVIGARISV